MANLTKNIGTVTLTGAVEKVTLPASYGWVWVKNMSEGDIFAGLSEDISEGADGVMVIPSGECGRIQTDGFFSVYLLGSGNVQIVGQNYADCPFKAAAKGGELPVASTDVLGGVMVDGTSITANEQGVISAVGSGGGLTLMGTYKFTSSTDDIVLGKLSYFPRGTRLLFEYNYSNSTSMSNHTCSQMIYAYVPKDDNSYCYSMLNLSSDYYIRVRTVGNNVYAFCNLSLGYAWNVYKWEV